MNVLLLAAAVVCQWDMTPQPSAKWNLSPTISPVKEEKLLQSLTPVPIDPAPLPELVPVPGKQPTPQRQVGYPLRNGTKWYVQMNGRNYSASVEHLMSGEHRGQFDPDWLRTLSQDDRDWLHSHHHAGIVNWSYAKRPGEFVKSTQVASSAVKPVKKMKLIRQKMCNGRQCWYQDVWVEDKS